MTCHVAAATDIGAVLFSDSQASSDRAEAHGLQKQYVGRDFLVGGAGHGDVIAELFAFLAEDADLRAADLEARLTQFTTDRLSDAARASFGLIVVLPDPYRVHRFDPGLFRGYRRAQPFASIGSGAEFVFGAIQRDLKVGVARPQRSIVDALIFAENYIEAADESLTVNDKVMLGVLLDGRTFVAGDASIQCVHAPPAVRAQWRMAAAKFEEIRAILQTIRGETREAERRLADVRARAMTADDVAAVIQSNKAIQALTGILQDTFLQYLIWYDALLGRAPAPPAPAS